MLTFVTWLWKPMQRYRSNFTTAHVNTLRAMIRRHYQKPHEFVVVTDQTHGLDPSIRVVPDWKDFANIPSPHGGHNPSCYRRLRAFHPDIAAAFGPRFVSIDIDTVIVGDVSSVFDRLEAFVAWKETDPRNFYNGSLLMMTAGARPQVWETFDPRTSPQAAKAAGHFGSDQAIISHVLGKGEATWSTADGIYSYNIHLRGKMTTLPPNAKVVFFHGSRDPWHPEPQALPWVKEYYRA